MRIDVWDYLGGIIGIKIRAVETLRLKRLAPSVGPAHEFGATLLGNRVQGHPETDGLLTVNNVIRLILMPGCSNRVSRLFHKNVIVKNTRRPRSHQ